MIHLPRNVASVVDACANDSARYTMQAVRLRLLPNNWWRMEATNGRLAVVLQGESQPSAADQRDMPEMRAPEAVLLEALIPPDAIDQAFKILPKDASNGKRHVGVALGDPTTLLVSGSSVSATKLMEGRYPDIDSVIPRKGVPLATITLDPDLLINVLRIVSAVCKDGQLGKRVQMHYFGPDKPIGFTADGAEGVMLDAILMPLT
jgi:DNA polymerase III sliding clamp (beta) subunit (PCNA family)